MKTKIFTNRKCLIQFQPPIFYSLPDDIHEEITDLLVKDINIQKFCKFG